MEKGRKRWKKEGRKEGGKEEEEIVRIKWCDEIEIRQ